MKKRDNISVVGSIALDSLETPNGNTDKLIGGSAVYFALAAAHFCPIDTIGVVGSDFPQYGWDLLNRKNISTNNVTVRSGNTFHWGGKYSTDLSLIGVIYIE